MKTKILSPLRRDGYKAGMIMMLIALSTMLLTTACSSEDDLVNNNNEQTAKKGYELPVTVNVTRGGDATRATYNESTRKLEFSTGDKLFVYGEYDGSSKKFAGTLDYVPATGKFSGTIYTQEEWTGTADALFTAANEVTATLLPNGYDANGSNSFLFVLDNDTPACSYDDTVIADGSHAFVASETAKATGVEQLSFERTYTYSSGFALAPLCAILNFTISGLEAGAKDVSLQIQRGTYEYTVTGSVTPNASGVATFAIGVPGGFNIKNGSNNLTVGTHNFTLPGGTALAAGKIYNIARGTGATVDLSMLDCAGLARASRWTANCYMVHTAGNYKLPLVYGNAIKNGATNAAAYTGVSGQLENFTNHAGKDITDPWIKNNKGADDNNITVTSAQLLWQDAEGLITNVGIDGDYLTLTVGENAADQEGNAVVAAKDGSGNIVWSWHIWVTKQTFAEADLTSVATGSHDYQVTPVNLGWVGDPVSQGYNTYYQWGRKDPFPGTGSVTFDGTTTATIADNIKNPTTFYKTGNKPNTSTAYNLWDAQQTGTGNITTATKKTVYDPCPAGFCVPTGNLYYYIKNGVGVTSDWDDTNKGRNLTSVTPNVFFPAAGYRNYSSGAPIGDVGSYGYCWSSSASGDASAHRLYIKGENFAWDLNYRARGFSVRPVAEE